MVIPEELRRKAPMLAIFDYVAKAIQYQLVEESLIDSKQLRIQALQGEFSYWLSKWMVMDCGINDM